MKGKFISALILSAILGGTATITNTQLASAQPANVQIEEGVPQIPGVEFSEEQKEKLQEIHEEASGKIQDILTSDQQKYLKNAIKLGRKPQDVIKSLSLSRQQKEQLEDVQFWQRQELFKVLNNEQKQQIMKTIRRRQNV